MRKGKHVLCTDSNGVECVAESELRQAVLREVSVKSNMIKVCVRKKARTRAVIVR